MAVVHDVRLALRGLLRTPGYALLVVATLGLGIGANAAIFALAHETLLRPLPYPDAGRLVSVFDRAPDGDTRPSAPPVRTALAARRDVFESVSASRDAMHSLTGSGEPESILGYRFGAGFFETLGVPPALGRAFSPEDDRPGAPAVTVLSHKLWQRRFGKDPAIVGRTLVLSGVPHTVIGVMPPGFAHPPNVELWTPLALAPDVLDSGRARFVRIVARLRPGVSLDRARHAVAEVSDQLSRARPDAVYGGGLLLETLSDRYRGEAKTPLAALAGAVVFVLLVACANVAGLSLARAATRRRDLAVRVALGASRLRLVREALVETAVLAGAGGALGLLLAAWGARLLPGLFPSTIANLSLPTIDSVPIGLPVVLFTLAATVVVVLAAGAAPALHATKAAPAASLAGSARGLTGGRGSGLALLVAAEVGLALVLLVGAGLLVRSFLHLRGGDLGYEPERVLSARLVLSGERYREPARQRAFHDAVLARVRAIPGVEAAGSVTFLPLSGWNGAQVVRLEGEPEPREGEERDVRFQAISPGYLDAMGIALRAGRAFDDRDREGRPEVALVSEGLARRFFPGLATHQVVGRRLVLGRGTRDEPPVPAEVVGVVADVRDDGPELPAEPEIYVPYAQQPLGLVCLAVRAGGDPAALARDLRRAVWAEDPEQPVSYLMPLAQLAGEALTLRRLSALLVAGFAGAALLVSALGVYGVVSQVVGRSTREIGLRVALGATREEVVRRVLARALGPTAWGALAGLASALLVARTLRGLLFGVAPADPVSVAAAALALVTAAALAAWIPARRAARVDPAVALRED